MLAGRERKKVETIKPGPNPEDTSAIQTGTSERYFQGGCVFRLRHNHFEINKTIDALNHSFN